VASKPTHGRMSAPVDAVIAYLPQHLLTKDDCTVFEEASEAFAAILEMKNLMEWCNQLLLIGNSFGAPRWGGGRLGEGFHLIRRN